MLAVVVPLLRCCCLCDYAETIFTLVPSAHKDRRLLLRAHLRSQVTPDASGLSGMFVKGVLVSNFSVLGHDELQCETF